MGDGGGLHVGPTQGQGLEREQEEVRATSEAMGQKARGIGI